MIENNPATPAQAATPGSNEQKPTTTSVATPPATAEQGKQPEGTVTISTKEFAQLQRDSARVRSFEKRKDFVKKQHSSQENSSQPGEVNEEIQRLTEETEHTRRELLKERVTNQVRNLLDKPEYAGLPKSTRDLILKNPAMLSEADNVEEALLDIEDFVLEQVAGLPATTDTQQKTADQKKNDPVGHETPPKINSGAPASTDNAGLEDLSNLRGSARSRAALRNSIKKAKGVVEAK